jgi:hypothetical protein
MGLFNRHKHMWEYEERGFGEIPKYNTPHPIRFIGLLKQCRCGEKMFFPDDPELVPQEIVDQDLQWLDQKRSDLNRSFSRFGTDTLEWDIYRFIKIIDELEEKIKALKSIVQKIDN